MTTDERTDAIYTHQGTNHAKEKAADLLHVFCPRGVEIPANAPRRARDGGPYTYQGETAHFRVFYEDRLGANGSSLAAGVLATCEQVYTFLQEIFRGITPPNLPFNIYIVTGDFGAYHTDCAATQIYCAAFSGTNVDLVRKLVVAEEVEVFSAAQGRGWDCGASNGEGLSRVLATWLYPAEQDMFASAASWLDTPDRPNFVDTNDPTDTNNISLGCSTLFLNWLRYQLGFSWSEIVAAAAPTLAQTYAYLTGQPDGFQQFSALLQAHFPIGIPSGAKADNVFPLANLNAFPLCGPLSQMRVPANSTETWFTSGWPESWNVVWTVVPLTTRPGMPAIRWEVQVGRDGADLAYWISVTNLTPDDVDIEGRYTVLGVCKSADSGGRHVGSVPRQLEHQMRQAATTSGSPDSRSGSAGSPQIRRAAITRGVGSTGISGGAGSTGTSGGPGNSGPTH
jgi:hypothetical protein